MTFLESGKEYQSVRSYKGLNFRDGRLTFGVPLWHDLCSSSPNISGVNLTVCLWHCNSPSCLHAGGEAEKSSRNVLAFFFLQMSQWNKSEVQPSFQQGKKKKFHYKCDKVCWAAQKTHKPPSKTRVRSSFPMHWSQPCVDAEAETRGRNEKCYVWTGE